MLKNDNGYKQSFPFRSELEVITISETSTSPQSSTTDTVAPMNVSTTPANFYQQTTDSLAADHTGRVLIKLEITSYIMR